MDARRKAGGLAPAWIAGYRLDLRAVPVAVSHLVGRGALVVRRGVRFISHSDHTYHSGSASHLPSSARVYGGAGLPRVGRWYDERVPTLAPVDPRSLFASDVHTLVVIAPHPDDDVIGCGGAIAAAARSAIAVSIVYVTDGAASHRGSRAFPPARLRTVRAAEARRAVAHLAPSARTTFLNWPDGTVPPLGSADAALLLRRLQVQIPAGAFVLAPWRRDPHPDHRAVAALAAAACAGRAGGRYAEYFVWLDERGDAADRPKAGEGRPVDIAIEAYVAAKRAALAEHRSQLGALISDADEAFVLPAAFVARAAEPIERYIVW